MADTQLILCPLVVDIIECITIIMADKKLLRQNYFFNYIYIEKQKIICHLPQKTKKPPVLEAIKF
jgi:hypothetical protein